MLETPVPEHQERVAETVARRADILWIDHRGGGHGYLRTGSRGFPPPAISLPDTTDSRSPGTTTDALPTAAVCSSSAVTPAGLLVQRATPALELGVDATCQIDESQCGQTSSGLHVRPKVGAGFEPESLAGPAHLACYPISRALSATVIPRHRRRRRRRRRRNVMQRADLAATVQTMERTG
jgi:hypothetical protein